MEKNRSGLAQFGYYISLFTAVITIITFGIAICTPPLSGPFCKSGCFEYPYHEIISRFPRDYFWMFPAIILYFSYMVMMISVHTAVSPEQTKIKKVSHIILNYANPHSIGQCLRGIIHIHFFNNPLPVIIYGINAKI